MVATQGARELPMPGARLQSREDRDRQLGALQVVLDGERLLREPVVPNDAVVAASELSILQPVPTVVPKVEALTGSESVLGTVLTRAETGHEPSLVFDRLNRPVHSAGPGNRRAEGKPLNGDVRALDATARGRPANAGGRRRPPFFAPLWVELDGTGPYLPER